MAENKLDGPVIGLSFDGTGYGTDGAIWEEDSIQGKWAEFLLASRATTIYGGTSEVQLNIIAKRVLGLPD